MLTHANNILVYKMKFTKCKFDARISHYLHFDIEMMRNHLALLTRYLAQRAIVFALPHHHPVRSSPRTQKKNA